MCVGFANLPFVHFCGSWVSRKTRGLMAPSSASAGKSGGVAALVCAGCRRVVYPLMGSSCLVGP